MSIQLPPQQNYPYGMLQAGRSRNAGGQEADNKIGVQDNFVCNYNCLFFFDPFAQNSLYSKHPYYISWK